MTFDMTGRPMEGFVALQGWIDLALAFVRTLPAKPSKPVKPRKSKRRVT